MTDCEELVEWLKNYFTPTNELVDIVYPVGAIYMSLNSVSPDTLFTGTTWERIESKFLLSSEDGEDVGETGGEETHTLSIDEMPRHNHPLNSSSNYKFLAVQGDLFETEKRVYTASSSSGIKYVVSTSNNDGVWEVTDSQMPNKGGNQAHNNMPPYLVVNVWKRTA